MAGLGRRTHYRKHLTDAVLFDLPEPTDNERLAKVVATRGSNQFDVRLVADYLSKDVDKTVVLAILPTKFRKLVWVKRNDFVIVQYAQVDESQDDEHEKDKKESNDSGGIRFMITHILYKDQIQHLTSKGLWPIHDPEFASTAALLCPGEEMDDGIVYPEEGGYYSDDEESNKNQDDLLFVNTNRVANLALEDSSSSEGEIDD